MFKVPVLIVIYNRVENTHNLFQILRKIKPEKLYVAGDGALHNDRQDYINCMKTRHVFMPEWKCNLQLLFNDEHLGKSKQVWQAINWFFTHEPEGIILFDDMLPNDDFFYYCEELLEKYRNNPKIVHISGTNFHNKKEKTDNSYYFSAYPGLWGFATWADHWKGFNLDMTLLNGENFGKMIADYFDKSREKLYWLRRYYILKKHKLDIWEYQYIYHLWYLHGLSITPNVNLVTNIGLRDKKRRIRKLTRYTDKIMPLVHPKEITQNKKADKYSFKHVYNKAFIKMFANWFNEYLLGKEKKI
ncbi:MAG: hypothetical protein LBU51_08495 [Bacteroidales bacterium]|jgi:hypothetical protein|nr:hypothetical protein [Bacteroidales bacterium]